jgi:hypothetical protein
VDDRAAVGADEDRALRRAGARNDRELGDVDALAPEAVADREPGVVVADRADEGDLDAQPRQRDGGRRGGTAARDCELGRDDAVVRARMARQREDRVERGQADADDVAAHEIFTVSSWCGR